MRSLGLSEKEQAIVLAGPKRAAMALRMLMHMASCKNGATNDECSRALGIHHQLCSPRLIELERAGCITPTGQRRTTQNGGRARVYKVTPQADFRLYLTAKKPRPRRVMGLSPKDQAILDAGKAFLARWGRVKSTSKRAELVKQLVRQLEAAQAGVDRG